MDLFFRRRAGVPSPNPQPALASPAARFPSTATQPGRRQPRAPRLSACRCQAENGQCVHLPGQCPAFGRGGKPRLSVVVPPCRTHVECPALGTNSTPRRPGVPLSQRCPSFHVHLCRACHRFQGQRQLPTRTSTTPQGQRHLPTRTSSTSQGQRPLPTRASSTATEKDVNFQ